MDPLVEKPHLKDIETLTATGHPDRAAPSEPILAVEQQKEHADREKGQKLALTLDSILHQIYSRRLTKVEEEVAAMKADLEDRRLSLNPRNPSSVFEQRLAKHKEEHIALKAFLDDWRPSPSLRHHLLSLSNLEQRLSEHEAERFALRLLLCETYLLPSEDKSNAPAAPDRRTHAASQSDDTRDVDDGVVDAETIHPEEVFWRGRYYFIRLGGYMLRSRLEPHWVPSWKNRQGENVLSGPIVYADISHLEDAWWKATAYSQEDATDARNSLHKLFIIRRIPKDSSELAVHRKFSENIKSHCIPITARYQDPLDPTLSLIVTPFLLPLYELVEFRTVDEVMECVEQILEGLEFFHLQGVYNVISDPQSIKMDARHVYPRGFHPIKIGYTAKFLIGAPPPRPYSKSSVRYYFSRLRHCVTRRGNGLCLPTPLPVSDDASPARDMYRLGIILDRFRKEFPVLAFFAEYNVKLRPADPNAFSSAGSLLKEWREVRKSRRPSLWWSWWTGSEHLGRPTFNMKTFSIPFD